MSHANSSVPESAQQAMHGHLARMLERHLRTPFRKPYADYNRAAFAASLSGWDGKAPLVLDAGCGVGHSTIALARALPDHWVIGVDQSADRLARRKPCVEAALPANMVFVRADLVDYWRLLCDAGVRLARHYILYPNPWPKIGHVGRRWHAHPVFPFIPRLGGVLECRTNWDIYACELAWALGRATGREAASEAFEAPVPLTPFERKYRDSGQTLFRVVLDLREGACANTSQGARFPA